MSIIDFNKTSAVKENNLENKDENKNHKDENKDEIELENLKTKNFTKTGKGDITFETFQNFIKIFFTDLTEETYKKIISPPVLNMEEINLNLFDLKCKNLSENDINIEDLLISSIISDENEEFDLEKELNKEKLSENKSSDNKSSENKSGDNDELLKKEDNENYDLILSHEKMNDNSDTLNEEDKSDDSEISENEKNTIQNIKNDNLECSKKYLHDIQLNLEQEKIPKEFFIEYKNLIEKIELRNINIEENPLIDLLKTQIEINNQRREILKEELNEKIKYIGLLKTLREIDKKIEKLIFKKLKIKRKKKQDEISEHVIKMIEERNKFVEIFKEDFDKAKELLTFKKDLFDNKNVDASIFGLEKFNIFPE